MKKNLNNLYLDACDILDYLNIDYGPVTKVTVSYRYTAKWGQCSYNRRTQEYSITINANLLNEEFTYEAAMDTMIHELLHAHKDRMCHTGEWKRCANLVNREFPQYNIKRCTSSEEKGVADKRLATRTYKYLVTCDRCHKTWKYQRAGRVIRALKRDANSCTCVCGSHSFTITEV